MHSFESKGRDLLWIDGRSAGIDLERERMLHRSLLMTVLSVFFVAVTYDTNYTWDSSHQIKRGGFVQLSGQCIGRVNKGDDAETSETDESVVARDAGGAGGWRVDSTAA